MTEPSDPYKYDVFISYSHKDEAWVVGTLLPRLEAAGLRVCIDFRDFIPGKAALLSMQDAVDGSRYTLLVMTPEWVASQWTLYESILARTEDPAGLQRRTIPLRLMECEIPKIIRMLTWVDFTRPDREDIAWRQLLTALGAPPELPAPEAPERPGWLLAHPYPMPPNFTGRRRERRMLSAWLEADPGHPLLVLRALGGFGKSALAWHWLNHDVDSGHWPKVVWWSFYEGDASFESFLRETAAYLVGQDAVRSGASPLPYNSPRQQLNLLLDLLHRPGILLILDGFERALRAYAGLSAAYQGDLPHPDPLPPGEGARTQFGWGEGEKPTDCISPLAELFLRHLASLPGLRARVLMTTRLRPRPVETRLGELLLGCREEELTQMDPADAVDFFRAQGVRGARAEIEAACQPYGYHPLSLRLLAGLIMTDLRQPGDIAAAKDLDLSGDLVQRQHHVLQQAYESLTPAWQRLLGRIACFRSPVSYEALRALSENSPQGRCDPGSAQPPHPAAEKGRPTPDPEFDAALRDLLARGLLHRRVWGDLANRPTYDLHPIVRRYAYDRLLDKESAHARLRDYFAAVPAPEKVQTLDDLALVIELYHHTVGAGHYDEARRLFRDRLHDPLFYQLGLYQLIIELLRALFPDVEDRPPRLRDESAQAWTLAALANSYCQNGQPRRAVPLFVASNNVDEKRRNKQGVAIGLGNLAYQQIAIGALRAAEASLRRSIELGREIEDEYSEAIGHAELGRLLATLGLWDQSEGDLAAALAMFEKQQNVQGQGTTWSYFALHRLLMSRASPPIPSSISPAPLQCVRRALELADEDARTSYPVERDYVHAHWLLGAAYRLEGDLEQAQRHLDEALARCRAINLVEFEADILIEMALLCTDMHKPDEAQQLAEEAVLIAVRCGYVLQEADAHLALARLDLAAGERAAAQEHAQAARQLAECDGEGYRYLVAYDKARALLGE